MKIYFFLLLFLSSGLCFAQETVLITSQSLQTIDSVYVYKPEGYSKKKQYPVVYLLHSHGANYRTFSRILDLQRLSDTYGFLIVCPDGLKSSWFMNSPLKSGLQYEDFFIRELMPYINKHFGGRADASFVTGASMGGHGALWLYVNYPASFLSAGSSSGVVNLRHSGFKKTTIAEHLGEYSDTNENFDRYSVVTNIKRLKDLSKTFIFDCGTEDYLYKANKSLRDSCDQWKIKATYIARPGAHTGTYWSESLPVHFEYFNTLLKTKL
ncbi:MULTISPECIES: alpha/beta hydrolase family protein [unclassified Sphingobacterium]|uniref:alpha/beta hydrolase n=1 Tax=unclassified Sphingobacterium TaxID=2609468 RepID=UPI002600AFB7|nr:MULTISPECIES: alpha/beta hydrolase-fold protein [unclassified Sphingobacterium]